MLDVSGKLNSVRKTLAGYRDHPAAGTWPAFIAGMHNPFASIHPTREAAPALASEISEANTWFRLQKEEALVKMISLKVHEIDHLEKISSLQAMEDRVVQALDADWAALMVSLEKFTEKGKAPEGTGLVGKSIPSCFKDNLAKAKSLAPLWVAKIWDFTRIKTQKTITLVEHKKGLAAQASEDVDMEPPTVEKLVDDAVQTALKGLNLQGVKGQPGQVSHLINFDTYHTNSLLCKRKTACEEEVRTAPSPKKARTQDEDHQTVRACRYHQEAILDCKWCRLWAKEEARTEVIVRSCKWNLSKPSSLPKQILDLPRDKALSIIRSRMPIFPDRRR